MNYDPAKDARDSYYAAIEAKRLRGDAAFLRTAASYNRRQAEAMETALRSAYVAMKIASALPEVSSEYDFGDAIAQAETALRGAALIKREVPVADAEQLLREVSAVLDNGYALGFEQRYRIAERISQFLKANAK